LTDIRVGNRSDVIRKVISRIITITTGIASRTIIDSVTTAPLTRTIASTVSGAYCKKS
jgi:hypothetical protein